MIQAIRYDGGLMMNKLQRKNRKMLKNFALGKTKKAAKQRSDLIRMFLDSKTKKEVRCVWDLENEG